MHGAAGEQSPSGLLTIDLAGGSNEERVEALAELKARLRSCAGGVFKWLSQQAQQPSLSPQESTRVLTCFNAWTRLGSLHDLMHSEDLQALLSLALTHLRQPDSEVRLHAVLEPQGDPRASRPRGTWAIAAAWQGVPQP
jgi:hypothetical protein